MPVGRTLATLLELTKARITVVVTLSVATGYVLFSRALVVEMLLPMAGVFLLACGAAALNQVQEWRVDAKMDRTRERPIPSGRIRSDWALLVVLVLVGAGLYLLARVEHHTLVVVGLGALALLWYNGVYLLLKRVTAFAVVPGSLVGAIPPVIGWCAAGGVPLDTGILEVAFFFFLWQIPHFWLLMQKYGAQYVAAGLPSPTAVVEPGQFRRITLAWTVAVAATGLALAVTQRLGVPWNLLILVASIALVLSALGTARRKSTPRAVITLFVQINLYALAMMAVLSLQALLGSTATS